jgi:hypothetical protein
MLPANYHYFTVEKLYHFRCFECNGWWSIGDWKLLEKIICPLCGRVSIAIEGNNDISDTVKSGI